MDWGVGAPPAVAAFEMTALSAQNFALFPVNAEDAVEAGVFVLELHAATKTTMRPAATTTDNVRRQRRQTVSNRPVADDATWARSEAI
jgi:hypothetical protein